MRYKGFVPPPEPSIIDTPYVAFWIGVNAGAQAALALPEQEVYPCASIAFRKAYKVLSLKSPFARGFLYGYEELYPGHNNRIEEI